MPNAKMDACENAPPAKVSNKPSNPLLDACNFASSNNFGFIPGSTI